MVKVTGIPGQPFFVGVTVMVAVCILATSAELKFMLPVPLAPSPMAGLSFVQGKVEPAVPEKATLTGNPAQTATLLG